MFSAFSPERVLQVHCQRTLLCLAAEAGVPELRAAGASMQLGPAAEVWGSVGERRERQAFPLGPSAKMLGRGWRVWGWGR